MNRIYDCVIIGAGPSGLAAANVLSAAKSDFLVIDKGDYLYKRSQNIPKDIVTGIGGGGLYSDGKVSFFPSGSNLYKLKPDLLIRSYQTLAELFQNFKIQIPAFDANWLNQPTNTAAATPIHNKHYHSIVLNQEQLYNTGFYLYDQIGKGKFLVNHTVRSVFKENKIYTLMVEDPNSAAITTKIFARNIIFCGGKFGSLNLSNYLRGSILKFKKFEFGIRIETEPENFDFNDIKQIDLKLLMQDDQNEGIEFRTFCFCRNGYIVHGKFEEINSFNGVSNKPPFSKTNFGINLRIKDESTFTKHKEELFNLKRSGAILKQSVGDFLSKRNVNWSEEIYLPFKNCLIKYFPKVSKSSAEITGPSFEYFGYYPELDIELKVNNENFWVCGDATGDFRGLMPSLTSGYLAAYSFLEKEKRDREALYDLVRLKISPTTKTRTAFTAQSKKFFYAKDVVCEYVLKEGFIPINPFQAFNYFLNDRVERGLIRRGNNELISRCDELWVFGPIADGVLFEIARAYELNMPIRFFTIASFAKEITEITDLSKLTFEPEVFAQIGKENLIRFISQSYFTNESPTVQLKLGFDETSKK